MMMKLVVVLLAAAVCIQGKKFKWNGGNSNLENCLNWDGPCPNGDAPVGTDLAGADGLLVGVGLSTSPPSTLEMGDYIKFPSELTIKFGPGTYTLKFSDGSRSSSSGGNVARRDNEDQVAEYVTPQSDDVTLNLGCPENWLVQDSNGNYGPTDELVCADDTAIATSPVPFQTQDTPLVMQSLTIGDKTVTNENCDTILSDATCAKLTLLEGTGQNELSVCQSLDLLEDGECSCTQPEKRSLCKKKEINLDDIIEEENKLDEIVTVALELEIPVSDFVPSVYPDLGGLKAAFDKLKADIESQIAEDAAIGAGVSDANKAQIIVVPSFSNGDSTMRLDVSLKTFKRAIIGIGAADSPDDVTDNMSIDVAAITQKTLQSSFKKTMTDLLVNEKIAEQDKAIEDAKNDFTGCTDCPTAEEVDDAITDVTDKFKEPKDVIDAAIACAEKPTVSEREVCIEAVIQQQIDNGNVEDEVTDEEAKDAGKTVTEVLDKLEDAGSDGTDLVDDLVDSGTEKKKLEDAKAVFIVKKFTSPRLVVGADIPIATKTQIMAAAKGPNGMKAKLVNKMTKGGFGFLLIYSAELRLSGKSRRRSAAHPMDAEVEFDFLCEASQTETQCNPFTSTAFLASVRDSIDNELLLFKASDYSTELCLDAASHTSCCLAKAGPVYTTSLLTKTEAQAKTDAALAVEACLTCGTETAAPDLTCPAGTSNEAPNIEDLSSQAAEDAAASSVATTAPAVTEESKDGGGSSSGVPIPIVAGAAAGAILLIAIVGFVLYKRQDRGAVGGGKAVDDRNVVAFENPMYDNPEKAASVTAMSSSQPIYDDADKNDGLYDEPAFNQMSTIDRSNPMYESAEHIDGFGEDEAGYLDAEAMDDNGYLDVAPDEN